MKTHLVGLVCLIAVLFLPCADQVVRIKARLFELMQRYCQKFYENRAVQKYRRMLAEGVDHSRQLTSDE